jgi:ankyrin repeat protein
MWEPGPEHHDVAWPMLLLEYAVEGTLKDYKMEIQDILAGDHADALLHCAARAEYLDTVVEFVNCGVDVNALDESQETPLLQASRAGYYEACEFLMRKGASAELASVLRETPIHLLILAMKGSTPSPT